MAPNPFQPGDPASQGLDLASMAFWSIHALRSSVGNIRTYEHTVNWYIGSNMSMSLTASKRRPAALQSIYSPRKAYSGFLARQARRAEEGGRSTQRVLPVRWASEPVEIWPVEI